MVLGLTFGTFFWLIIMTIVSIIAAVVYGLTFKDDDEWWTIERMFQKSQKNGNGGNK